MSCLIHARYNMEADIYRQVTTRDPDTRQVDRDWVYDRTVDCQARSIASEGIRTVGSTETFRPTSYDYLDEDYLRMNITYRMSKRDRVKGIRTKSGGQEHYTDDDGNPIEFEVLGVQPVPNPFGQIVEWDVLLYKVQDE